MRLIERTLEVVRIARRATEQDGLGGSREVFSPDMTEARGSFLPAGNTLNYKANAIVQEAHGVHGARSIKLILPKGTEIEPGDGVCRGKEEVPGWRCITVDVWSGHVMVKLEKIS